MMPRLLGLFVVGLLLAADDGKNADKAAKQIEATWQVVSQERDGNKNEDAESLTVTIKDGKYEVKRGDESVGKGKVKVDATKKPHTLVSWSRKGTTPARPSSGSMRSTRTG